MNLKFKQIWKVKLYPVRGSEQDGLRPCLIVSPNSMNEALQTVIVAPLTTSLKKWPTRVDINVDNIKSQVCLEHIRSVSKTRFISSLGEVSDIEARTVLKHLNAIFS